MDLTTTDWTLTAALALIGLGFGVGAYGTLIGAGGGFLLVPVLLLIDPNLPPARVTAISLTVVFFNAYSGTWAYARQRRVDFQAGVLYAAAGIPGAILGVWVVHFIPSEPFAIVFSGLLLLVATYLIWHPGSEMPISAGASSKPHWLDSENHRRLVGSISSGYLGLIASLLGIGGGILHVPFLIRVLRFPPHVATATSHFVLMLVTLTATIAHLIRGELQDVLTATAFLALGVMLGAPLGATLSGAVRGSVIVRLLALALALVALRLLWKIVV